MKKLVVVGGGAAGYFCAIEAAKGSTQLEVILLEGSNKVLSKVLISGGGRCNVTHACEDAQTLTQFYPRGHEHLKPAFEQFQCTHTIQWFQERGVPLKTEIDGRIFPISDRSESIAQCLQSEAEKYGVLTKMQTRVTGLKKRDDGWVVHTNKETFHANFVMLASGSNQQVWDIAEQLGLKLISPVPSLFTFNIQNPILDDLSGTSFERAEVSIKECGVQDLGPLLITHRGLSGPVILKISAWAARELFALDYKFDLNVNWIGLSRKEVETAIRQHQSENPKQYLIKHPLFGLTKRFWLKLCGLAQIPENRNWAEAGKKQLQPLIEMLCGYPMRVSGKSTFKEEFVTAGGIDLEEVDMHTFALKNHAGLYAAGEILDIDAVTGGFNFQAAWTGGYLAGRDIADKTATI